MKYMYLALNWVFGLFFLLATAGLIFEYFWGGLFSFFISMLLLPPVRNFGVDHRSGQSSKIAGKESRPTKLKSWEMGCRSRFLRDRDCGRNDDQRRNFVYSKTKRKLSARERGIAIFALFIIFSAFFVVEESQKAKEAVEKTQALAAKETQEKAQKTAAIRQKNIDYFNQNSSQVLSRIKNSFEKGDFKEVISLSSKYLPAKNDELSTFNRKAKSKLAEIKRMRIELAEIEKAKKNKKLLTELKSIPVSEYEKNLKLYKELNNLNPIEEKYKTKIKYYSNKIAYEKKCLRQILEG